VKLFLYQIYHYLDADCVLYTRASGGIGVSLRMTYGPICPCGWRGMPMYPNPGATLATRSCITRGIGKCGLSGNIPPMGTGGAEFGAQSASIDLDWYSGEQRQLKLGRVSGAGNGQGEGGCSCAVCGSWGRHDWDHLARAVSGCSRLLRCRQRR
jgi:hypothetical protein